MRIPLLIAALSFAASVPAFQSYQGSRFGNVQAEHDFDTPWGIVRADTGYFLAGSVDDSSCCSVSDSGAGFATAFPNTFMAAWSGRVDDDGKTSSSKRILTWASSRWYGLEKSNTGGILGVGVVMDTLDFNGWQRISHHSVTPDTMSWDSLLNPDVILPRGGGGGGIGVARWSASGELEKLSLFRNMRGNFRNYPIGWDIHASASGAVSIAGTISFRNASDLWIDSTKFSVPAGSQAFLAGLDSTGKGLWFRSAFLCLGGMPSAHVRTANGLWLTQGDSVFPTDSGPTLREIPAYLGSLRFAWAGTVTHPSVGEHARCLLFHRGP